MSCSGTLPVMLPRPALYLLNCLPISTPHKPEPHAGLLSTLFKPDLDSSVSSGRGWVAWVQSRLAGPYHTMTDMQNACFSCVNSEDSLCFPPLHPIKCFPNEKHICSLYFQPRSIKHFIFELRERKQPFAGILNLITS